MLLHGKIESSAVNGPGNRAVIWFQGCTLNCPGCWNPNTHAFLASSDVRMDEIQTWLMNLEGIEGVTFSGGEPMQHFCDVLEIARYLRDVRPELSIGMFTGYTARELETGNFQLIHPSGLALVKGDGKLWDMLRPMLDFAVMGRFNASKVTTEKPLCGSSNQDIVLFSDRYTGADFRPQQTQVTVSPDGLVQITGFPGREFIQTVSTL
jgi:anaerobic ribonucleoside-triphosphate reductase activating protein